MQGVRFVAASFAAFCIDLVFVLLLLNAFGLPLWLAVGISFVVVGACLYFVHEFWTFRHALSTFTPRRLGGTLVVSSIALTARVGLVALLDNIRVSEGAVTVLYILAGSMTSFSVNYLLNNHLVFGQRRGN